MTQGGRRLITPADDFAWSYTATFIIADDMTHPHLHEFVRECACRAGYNWTELYDEMCRTAARRKFRGLGYNELREMGLPLDLNGLDATAAVVDDVLGKTN